MSDLYRRATTDELIAWTRGGCSDDSVQVIDAVRVEPDATWFTIEDPDSPLFHEMWARNLIKPVPLPDE